MQPVNFDDISGKRFGVLEAIKQVPVPEGKSYTTYWLCKCICGNEKVSSRGNLRKGKFLNCTCGIKKDSPKTKDIKGQTFGYLTAIEPMLKEKHKGLRWLCKCKCGNEKIVSGVSLRSNRTTSCGCRSIEIGKLKTKENSPFWKGGRHITNHGYVQIKNWEHSNSNSNGYVAEHVLAMSKFIGRPLIKGETVHHKNGIKTDNRIENLELWSSNHPSGQRVEDMIEFCENYLKQYAPHKLK